jgi:hypothetical protein
MALEKRTSLLFLRPGSLAAFASAESDSDQQSGNQTLLAVSVRASSIIEPSTWL